MTPQQTLTQINDLIGALISLSLSNEQNFPATHGKTTGAFEITVGNSEKMSIALRNVAYRDIYGELDKEKCFNIKMIDGALVSLCYRFRARAICEHRLSYLPSPDLEHFQNDPELYLEDKIYADVLAKNIVPFPIRFDYSNDPAKFMDVHHPYSHLSLGQFLNCRIPVCSPLTPLTFGGFILRNFYNTAFRKYSDKIPRSVLAFPKSITANERKIPHFVCG